MVVHNVDTPGDLIAFPVVNLRNDVKYGSRRRYLKYAYETDAAYNVRMGRRKQGRE